ncbi:tRNA modification GTPase MnmE [Symmachiella dynata]|uniref:GTPase n=1 Tax=Symmachiella dynata TaxID=2527995 RepID=UPI001189DD6F|nr:GTPase [Symmachiella dynata]QDT51156.1 tRNA modification GTPase MnmE [Symmachiella dynata]
MPHAVATAEVITPRGRGAVATLVLTGDADLLDQAQLFRAANGLSVSSQSLQRITFGDWGSQPSEQVVLCRTADDKLEIHCHGGDAAVRRILADLRQAGYTTFDWENKTSLAASSFAEECAAAIANASTLRTAAIALDQQNSVLRAAYEQLQITDWNAATRAAATAQLDALLRWADIGRHLTRPWSVVLAGQPNVGKSSLINALVGFSRAVVHDRPGTTRDVVTAETALEGWPIQFADTAGIRAAAERIEAAGIELAQTKFAAADCRILVLDSAAPPNDETRALLDAWPDAIVVANKCDLPNAWNDALPTDALLTSVTASQGIDQLARAVVKRLIPALPPDGTAVPLSQRQIDLLQIARAALVEDNRNEYASATEAILAGSV